MHRRSAAIIPTLLVVLLSPAPTSAFCTHPDPFNPSTELWFELPERARVDLRIHDLPGRVVAVLAEGEMNPGIHTVQWDAGGQAAGTYLARFTAVAERDGRTLTQTRKLLLVR